MKEPVMFTVIKAYMWLGGVLMFVFLGRVLFTAFRHVDVREVHDAAFGGKKPHVAPEIQTKLDRGGRLYRRVMFVWFLGFILLAVGTAMFRR